MCGTKGGRSPEQPSAGQAHRKTRGCVRVAHGGVGMRQVAFNLFLLFAIPSPIQICDSINNGDIVEKGGPCVPLQSDGTGNNPGANYRTTIIYNAFVWAQLFNEVSSRKIYNELNCFSGILTNGMFIGVLVFSAILQFCTVQLFGPHVFNAVPLSGAHWLLCLILGFVSIPLGMVTRFLPPFDWVCDWFPTGGEPDDLVEECIEEPSDLQVTLDPQSEAGDGARKYVYA